MRPLQKCDFNRGFPEVMNQLADIGNLTEDTFLQVWAAHESTGHTTLVIEHTDSQRIVGSASLIVERKFLHGGASVGHVEDVVTDATHRGKGLASRLLEALTQVAKKAGCYKVILDCADHNVAFYERCGYEQRENQMRLDVV